MSAFRLLDLPDELRLKLYRFMLPRGERLHLDPQNVIFPIPYIVEQSYGETLSLLQTCKKIHYEATQFIYTNNMVNIILPEAREDFLAELGHTACQYISKLEVHVTEGLVDLGEIWGTLKECPRLSDIRLVFYHERKNWSRTLAQLTQYVQNEYVNSAGTQLALNLSAELHTSIWAQYSSNAYYRDQFKRHLRRADRHQVVYPIKLPSQLHRITITASVDNRAANGFCVHALGADGWRFTGDHPDDTSMKKTIRLTYDPDAESDEDSE